MESKNPPLVIVSEYGKHDKASRRIVRAQAARASASQSRLTRARNREDRLSHGSRPRSDTLPLSALQRFQVNDDTLLRRPQSHTEPLLAWYQTIAVSKVVNASEQSCPIGSVCNRKLPFATPKGFTALARAGYIDDDLLTLVSHIACFDFLSPGLDLRLRRIFAELVVDSATQASSNDQQNVLHRSLRIACLCVTIYQAQIISATQVFDSLQCNHALSAAWKETLLLDQEVVPDHNTDDVWIWITFVICITSRNDHSIDRYSERLSNLLPEADQRTWDNVRHILLQFIFSRGLMEESCHKVHQSLGWQQSGERSSIDYNSVVTR